MVVVNRNRRRTPYGLWQFGDVTTKHDNKSHHLHTSKNAYASVEPQIIHANDRVPLSNQPVIFRLSNESTVLFLCAP